MLGREARRAERAETGTAGVRMVALWILATAALFVLTRRRRTRRPQP